MVRSHGGGRRNLATLPDIKKTIRLVQKRPCITAKCFKRILGEEGEKFTLRRIQEILQKAGYKSRHAALLTRRIK